MRALYIYGPQPAMIKASPTYSTYTISSIEHSHMAINLGIDFFFVIGIIYFHSISNDIKFRTIDKPFTCSESKIVKSITSIIGTYQAHGMTTLTIFGDNEFDCVRNKFTSAIFDITTANQHVPLVERSIHTIKYHVCCCMQHLPFLYWPRVMKKSVVNHKTECLNAFPNANGISDDLSPADIVLGTHNLSYK